MHGNISGQIQTYSIIYVYLCVFCPKIILKIVVFNGIVQYFSVWLSKNR